MRSSYAIGLSALICVALMGSAMSAAAAITPVAKWGTLGTGQGEFNTPVGVATDADGNVYVADVGNNRIQKFSSSGNFLLSWGSSGSGNGQFGQVLQVTVGPDGSVYTTEDENQRVQKFSSSGAYLTKWGAWGSCHGQFESPVGIAVDALGNVYVADTGNQRIQKFDSDGAFLATWGSWTTPCDPGDFEGGLQSLGGIDVNGAGDLTVVNGYNVHRFSTDGDDLGQWGLSVAGALGGGMAIDPDGNVLVSTPYRDYVQVYDAGGSFVTEFGGTGNGDGQFNWPGAIAIDGSGNIYVVDTQNHRIQKFVNTGATDATRTTWGQIKRRFR